MPHTHHKFKLDDYGKDFMNRCDVSVYIVPFDPLILTLGFFNSKKVSVTNESQYRINDRAMKQSANFSPDIVPLTGVPRE